MYANMVHSLVLVSGIVRILDLMLEAMDIRSSIVVHSFGTFAGLLDLSLDGWFFILEDLDPLN